MEILKLIGVVIVIIGFTLKLDTIATVIIAGLVTGIVAGIPLPELLTILGQKFLSNRLATMFVLTLPVIGLSEKYGLKEKAIDLIKKFKAATAGRIAMLYQMIRVVSSALSLRLGGHPQFVRPLINPMAQAAVIKKHGNIDEQSEDDIKGIVASAENTGNFFGQNVFMASSGTLLISSTLLDAGFASATALSVAKWSIPIAVSSIVLAIIYYALFDKKIGKRLKKEN